MSPPRRPRFALALPLVALTAVAYAQPKPKPVTYAEHVAPLLEAKCTYCHDAEDTSGGLDLSTYDALMRGGSSGDSVAPGDAEASKLYRVCARLEQPYMPRGGSALSKRELEVLRRWIDQGARKDGKSPAPKIKKKKALALPVRPVGEAILPWGLPLEPVRRGRRADALVALAASPGAPLFAVGALDQVFFYSAPELESARDEPGLVGALPFPGRAHTLRFSQDGSLLLAAGGEGARRGRALLYDLVSGREVFRLEGSKDVWLGADLREDQRQVALGGPTRKVEVYDVATGERQFRLTKHTDWVTALAYSPDGVLLATADRAGGLHVWESLTGELYQSLPGHPGAIHDLAWRPDSNVLVTGCDDGFVRAFELFNGKEVKKARAHPGGVLGVAFAPDGSLLTAGRDRFVKRWTPEGKPAGQTRLADQALRVASDASGKLALSGDLRGKVRVWQLVPAKKKGQLRFQARGEVAANPPTIAERLERAERRVGRAAQDLRQAWRRELSARLAARAAAARSARAGRLAQQAAREARRPPAPVAMRQEVARSLRRALSALEATRGAPIPAPPAAASGADAAPSAAGVAALASKTALLREWLGQAEAELKTAIVVSEPERRLRRELGQRAAQAQQRARRGEARASAQVGRAQRVRASAATRFGRALAARARWRAEARLAAAYAERARAAALAAQGRAQAAAARATWEEARQRAVQTRAAAFAARAALTRGENRLLSQQAVAREALALQRDLCRSLAAARRLRAARAGAMTRAEGEAAAAAEAALTKAREHELQLEAIASAGRVGAELALREARAAWDACAQARRALPGALEASRAARAALARASEDLRRARLALVEREDELEVRQDDLLAWRRERAEARGEKIPVE